MDINIFQYRIIYAIFSHKIHASSQSADKVAAVYVKSEIVIPVIRFYYHYLVIFYRNTPTIIFRIVIPAAVARAPRPAAESQNAA